MSLLELLIFDHIFIFRVWNKVSFKSREFSLKKKHSTMNEFEKLIQEVTQKLYHTLQPRYKNSILATFKKGFRVEKPI